MRDEINQKILLYYNFKDLLTKPFPPDKNFLVPLTTNHFNFGSEKLTIENKQHLAGTMEGSFEGEYLEPPLAFPTLQELQNQYFFTFLYQDPNTLQTYQLTHQFKSANQSSNILAPPKVQAPQSIWYYMLLALLGGIILNFMPCVLPVVSLKLFGLIKHKRESRRTIFFHNLSYTAGVLFSFIILALIVFIIQSAGGQIGWGFQLQSPVFVGLMAQVIFIFSLNLFGLFEFNIPGGKFIGNIRLKEGLFSDFAGGILAVILSTPCSAPLLGTALTFAFTTTTLNIFILFLSIGLGLAFPFIITGIFPGALIFLPPPGNWMNIFKKFLGLSLLLTSVWLISVLTSLINPSTVLTTLIPVLLLSFLGFLLKATWPKLHLICWFLSLVFFVVFVVQVQIFNDPTKSDTSKLIRDKQAKGLTFSTWHPTYKYPSDQISFIDFSATWCLTCKVNEEIILNTDAFKALVKKYNLNLLLADWTSGDPVITKWLKEHGYAGVPAYFIVSKNQKFYDLGETITINEIEENIKKAQDE